MRLAGAMRLGEMAHRLETRRQQLGEHAIDGGIEIVGDLLDQADP